MKPIQQADFLEMSWMPFVFGLIILMILRSVVFGEMSNVVDLFAVYCYFGVFSIGSFWYRLYTYGHNLDPHAPDAHQAVHAAADRREADREFPRIQFPGTRRLSALSLGLADRAGRLVFAKGKAGMKHLRRFSCLQRDLTSSDVIRSLCALR